jgi:hypothetical protein
MYSQNVYFLSGKLPQDVLHSSIMFLPQTGVIVLYLEMGQHNVVPSINTFYILKNFVTVPSEELVGANIDIMLV